MIGSEICQKKGFSLLHHSITPISTGTARNSAKPPFRGQKQNQVLRAWILCYSEIWFRKKPSPHFPAHFEQQLRHLNLHRNPCHWICPQTSKPFLSPLVEFVTEGQVTTETHDGGLTLPTHSTLHSRSLLFRISNHLPNLPNSIVG